MYLYMALATKVVIVPTIENGEELCLRVIRFFCLTIG